MKKSQVLLSLLSSLLLAACSGGGRPVPSGPDGFAVLDLSMPFNPNADMSVPSPVIERFYAHEADKLYLVDPDTFELTLIGDFGISDSMTDLAVNAAGDVYGISSTALYYVDSTDAHATQIATGITTSNVALTFEPNGTLLASDKDGAVFRINATTGQSTQIGAYGQGFNTAGDLVVVADGTMFGISESGPGTTTASNVLLKVNTSSGQATGVGPLGYKGVFGVAYSKGAVIAFTKTGEIIKIDPATGVGTLVKNYPGKVFYGAGSNPLQPIG